MVSQEVPIHLGGSNQHTINRELADCTACCGGPSRLPSKKNLVVAELEVKANPGGAAGQVAWQPQAMTAGSIRLP